ncbi:MAG: ATP-binding protein [Bacteroidales bacterium]
MSLFGKSANCIYLLLFLLAGLCFKGYSQERGLIQSKYYSSGNYNAGAQNWAAVQDLRGVMYFGNSSGILEFDGESWTLYRADNHSTIRSLGVDSEGTLYAGAFGEMGFLKPNGKGEMLYHSLLPLIDDDYLDFKEIWEITCFSDSVFFLSDNYIFLYHNGKFTYFPSRTQSYYLNFKVNNQNFVQELGTGLLKFEHDSFRLVNGSEYFANIPIHNIFQVGDGFLVGTRKDGFYLFNPSGNRPVIQSISELSANAGRVNGYFKKNSYYHGVQLSDSLYAFSSIQGDILVVDKAWRVHDIINHESVGIKTPTLYLYLQGGYNLWLALDNGISLVEVLSPFRYWNEALGINGIITDVAKLNGYLYVSTGTGIFYTTTSDNSFSLNQFSRVAGRFEQAWEYLYFQPPRYSSEHYQQHPAERSAYKAMQNTILLVAARTGIFRLSGAESYRISGYEGISTLYQSVRDPTKVFVGLTNGVAQLSYRNGKWVDDGLKFGINANIIDIVEDSTGALWISTRYRGIFRVLSPFSKDSSRLPAERYDSTSGIPMLRPVKFVDGYNPLLFYAGSEYFYFNDSLHQFSKYSFPGKTESEEQKRRRVAESLSWGRILDEVNSSYYVVDADDKNLWFSTNGGIFRNTPDSTRDFYGLPAVIIRKVVNGDSIIFSGTNFVPNSKKMEPGESMFPVDTGSTVNLGTVFKYKNNSFTFSYAWPYFEGSKRNQYSYRLIGYNNEWSEWDSETKKEYTNLPEGDYTFCVKAKNVYGVEGRPAMFVFSISPPWHRTYFAYLGYIVTAILFILLVVRLYTYKLIHEKNKLEQLVNERTQEILIQNEEILVQAEHLKDANERISAKNAELEAQKHEIETKKNQLEVSNSTKNKFFRIIAHDLRNPISTLVNTTGYILTDFDKFDRPKTKHIIEELNRLSLTTYNLLENLLDWSTNQTGEIKFNPQLLNLPTIINENIELLKTKIDSKKIKLDIAVAENIQVFADANMLHTVIRNIVTNAVKFTRDNGTIKIYSRADGASCFLTIADNGIGISRENVTKLFQIDKDVIATGTHNEKGSGLGLILSKEFVERNGGEITVESELHKGSTFTIKLKLG